MLQIEKDSPVLRIEIEYPEKTIFSCQSPVRISDLSGSGHVAFDSLVSIINDASARFFKKPEILELTGRTGRIYADLAVVYKSESFFGDILRVDMAIGDIADKGFDMIFRIISTSKNHIVALAKIGVLFFDYQTHQVVPIPEGILDLASASGTTS